MLCEEARNKITAIYSQPEIDECISKLVKQNLRHDFKQELFLILLQVPCETIVSLNGDFKYYVVRIILNLVRQKRNIFHKTYLDKTVEYNTDKLRYETNSPADADTITERAEREKKEEMFIERLEVIDLELGNDNYPYHAEMIKLIAECGSTHAVSRQTGIPQTTVMRTVKKVRQHLRK